MSEIIRGIDAKRTEDPVFAQLLDFSSPPISASIRPLSGAEIHLPGGIEKRLAFTEQPKLSFLRSLILRRRPKAKAEFDTSGGYIASLLNGKAKWSELIPLPFSRGDASSVGTRGLRVISPRFPGKILCLTGIGVVKAISHVEVKGKFEKKRVPAEFIVEPPKDRKKVSSELQMVTGHVDSEGRLWSVENHSPFGSYAPGDAANKAEHTQKYGPHFGVELVAWGKYSGSGNEWFAYAIPDDSFTATEAIIADLMLPAESVGKVYGPVVESLFREIRGLHQKGVVHMQLHPGNLFAGFRDGKPVARIADWSTTQRTDALEDGADFENNIEVTRLTEWEEVYAGLSPAQKALGMDLANALRGSVSLIATPQLALMLNSLDLLSFGYKERKLSIEATNFYMTPQIVTYQMHMLTRAVAAYLGVEGQDTKRALMAHFFEKLEELSDKRAEWHGLEARGLRNQIGFKYEEYAVNDGIVDLIMYTSKRLVTDRFNLPAAIEQTGEPRA